VGGRRRTSRSGLAENGLPPATRGERRVSDRPSSLEARKSAPGVPVRHTGWLAGWFRRTVQKSVRSIGDTGGKHRPVGPPQRDRSRGQKPPNGALKGVAYSIFTRQLSAPRPNCSLTTTAVFPRVKDRPWPQDVRLTCRKPSRLTPICPTCPGSRKTSRPSPRYPRSSLRLPAPNAGSHLLPAASVLLLDRRALHRTERAKHAAVPRIGAQQRLAIETLVEELAGVRGHGFQLGEAVMRASQNGFKNDSIHRGITFCASRAGKEFSELATSIICVSADTSEHRHILQEPEGQG